MIGPFLFLGISISLEKPKHMRTNFFLPILFIALLGTGCSKRVLISTGANDHKPLLFNNEYQTQDLKPITVEGSAFWGIPSFKKNNQNNNKKGFLFTFNGVEVGKVKRIFPILTLLGYSYGAAKLIQKIGGRNDDYNSSSYGEYNIKLIPAFILGLPISGTFNNLSWNNAAFSGASETLSYRLVDENPGIDVFFYPKYDIKKKNIFSEGLINPRYLWFQDIEVNARVSGATLKKSK